MRYIGARLLWIGLAAYLCALLGLGLWAAIRTESETTFVRSQVVLSDGWKQARYWAAEEETLERKYRLYPGDRVYFNLPISWLNKTMLEMKSLGSPSDKGQVDIVLAANRRYARAMSRMFDAVDRKDVREVEAIHARIDPTYDRLEHVIDREERFYNRAAYRALANLDRTQRIVVQTTPFVGLVGVGVVIAFFLLLRGYQRRDERMVDSTIRRLQRAASYDALTSLGNHGYFKDALRIAVADSVPGATALKLALVDVDKFKMVNDLRGHQQGDIALQAVASLLEAHFPDLAFRVGGDEFAIILPKMTIERVRSRLEAIRADIELNVSEITVSIGVGYMAHRNSDDKGVFAQADAMLYEAKHRGRNRIAYAAEHLGGELRLAAKEEV